MSSKKTKKISLTLVTFIIVIFVLNYKHNSNIENIDLHTLDATSTLSYSAGIKGIYPTLKNGRIWTSNWNDGIARIIESGDRDPADQEFIMRGDGFASIDGKGVIKLSGVSPRMYVYDAAEKKKWNNVEVTFYAKRVSESEVKSSQGFVVGARSEHQDASETEPCFGRTYYGRFLYDGRAVFQKEVIHEGAYSINKPTENNKVYWDTPDGTLPKNEWIGVKYVVHTLPDNKSVKLELYRDLTDGKNGGDWQKIAEYTDNGNWSQTDTGVNVQDICGYSASEVLLKPGTSVFIRNDNIVDAEYKDFSVREIE